MRLLAFAFTIVFVWTGPKSDIILLKVLIKKTFTQLLFMLDHFNSAILESSDLNAI